MVKSAKPSSSSRVGPGPRYKSGYLGAEGQRGLRPAESGHALKGRLEPWEQRKDQWQSWCVAKTDEWERRGWASDRFRVTLGECRRVSTVGCGEAREK
jgi:hypothetical protein